ncbi:hypothetical protein clem_07240 [Legionella clemsonensis]|uniref:Uncharacterized protein n=2 Tax=Legionella clemsonensis TaxID=1867846 RepID=A0A222P2E6_9GAMM|nr:hypothetical protein clem_07240 [Legionella clemsonensis]
MSAESRSKYENRRDERSKALENNPCGICRASGMPVCKGHGGGGGGGDEAKDENFNNENAPTPKYVPKTIEVKTLSSYLENSEVWNSEEDFLYHFKNDSAIFSIELDAAKGLIHFQGNELLSADDEKDLNELYDKIEDELNKFTDEVDAQNISRSREGDNLRLNIPDPKLKLYDQFVTRLLNKNLIPDNNYKTDIAYKADQNVELKVDEKGVATSYKSPNPFDISSGPKPTNGFKE